jgi:hypothetical protein
MPAYAAKEPDGLGVGKSAHPFAVTVEAKVPVNPDIIPSLPHGKLTKQNAIVPDGYGIKYHAYHTITEGVLYVASFAFSRVV